MKFTNPLNDIFGSPSNIKVLRVLAKTEIDLTGRQVAQLAELDPATCQRALDRLAALNMLTVRRVVRAKLYKLRSGNIINERLLEPLFAYEGKLLEEQLQNFAGNIGDIAESIILFGSTARGEEVHGSDLDLCVVVADTEIRENAEKVIADQIGFLTDATGITPTIFTITQNDFQQRLKEGDSLLKAIVRDGRVVVGTSIESLISNYGKEEINYKSK